MSIDTAAKELAIQKKLKERNQPLRDRMDKTYRYFRGDLFAMPKKEGKWDEVTSNRAPSEGWKMINVLGAAMRSIFNEAKKEDRADREKLNYNELLVNGMLFSAERSRDGLPESPLLQAEMAFFRVVRGWGAYRLLVLEDDDGRPYLDLAVWDARNVSYIPGRNGLLKVYYDRFVTEDEANDEYPGKNLKGDTLYKGLVKIVDVWDCSGTPKKVEEAVIAGSEYVKEPEPVLVSGKPIDYLPVRIKAGGAIPLVMDDNEDNIKKVGEDFLVNNRELIEVESRLLTYNLSAAGQEAGEATILKYDTSKGPIPPEWNPQMRDPRGKKGVFLVDAGKGQEVGELIPQAQGSRVQIALAQIDAKLNTGGLHPIAFGEGGPGETAFGVDIRNHNTREHISPFRLAMESDYVWMAQEITRQYKSGSFKSDVEFSGYNSKAKWFSEKIKADKIDPSKIFKCKLIVDELRDRAAHSGMAIQEKQAGLLPLREILDIHQLSDDPDSSIDALYQEIADQMFEAPAVKGYLAKIEDYAKTKGAKERFELNYAFMKLLSLIGQNQQAMGKEIGGPQPRAGQSPQLAASGRRMTARTAQPGLPPQIVEAARNRQGGA